MSRDPASIRYKNPGAMWPGARATKWGSREYVTLNDGQGNKIAIFPTFVQGAAADFDLWASNYTGMTLEAAIDKWSGHNSPKQYVKYLQDETGVSIKTMVTRQFLAGAAGWRLLKAQARWESGMSGPGKNYPMTDEEWQQAQAMVFEGAAQPKEELPYLRVGDHGDDVARMQGLLNEHGAKIAVDGKFGNIETKPALMAFQESAGLRPDGVCGPLTWKALGVSE